MLIGSLGSDNSAGILEIVIFSDLNSNLRGILNIPFGLSIVISVCLRETSAPIPTKKPIPSRSKSFFVTD
ncbi:hypothetical protein AYI68_g7531 [Smittium mucronatum]|uniref:Uncharacterized protein n=1 Tax=Smittium mucronatum TaxID=133383 RepID=A0A1R0GNG2_9FUNG|nr:hypothetical protein AYI68_g7531 [Smittium mucronatum]